MCIRDRYIDFRPFREIGNEVLTVEHLSKTIDGEKILDDISFILGREDKVALVGPNERAKTVLFKILSGEMEPDEGSYKWGLTTSQAYFPKDNSAEFDNDDTIVEWLTQYSPEKDVTYVRGSVFYTHLNKLLPLLEERIKQLEEQGGALGVLLCTGLFPSIQEGEIPIIYPFRLMETVLPCFSRRGRVGIVTPDEKQKGLCLEKWSSAMAHVAVTVCNPYDRGQNLSLIHLSTRCGGPQNL